MRLFMATAAQNHDGSAKRGRPARLGLVAVVLAQTMLPASTALAFDTLRFSAPGAASSLTASLEQSSLLRTAKADGLTDAFEVYTIARAEYGQLIGSFYEAGYFAPVISIRIDGVEAADISPLSPPSRIGVIEVTLNPGPPFVFGRADIGPLAPDTVLPPAFRSGEPARSVVIRDAVGVALDEWRDIGHAKAEPVDQQINARHAAQVLDASVTLDPGPRVTFGQLRPEGQARMRPERIAEIAGLPTGEVFSPQALRRSAERLRETGTFASVALREQEALNPDGSLDIGAALVEAPLRRIGLGVEYDTESGGKLSGFWLHRNLLGGAERLRIEGLLGGIAARQGGRDYRLRLDFARPATFTPDTTLTIGALVESEKERDFTARRARAEIGLTHRFSDTLTGSAGIGVLAERAVFGPTRNLRQDYRLLLLPLTVTRDTRDNTRAATSGTFANLDLTPFFGLSGADSGARAAMDLRAYRALDADARFVLAARAQMGVVVGAALNRTPRDFLFYSGGGGSVRGQPFRSMGVAPGGVASGGQGFAALAVEARARLTEKIGLAAFVDTGHVSEGPFTGASDWHSGAGIGVRYDTQIGPLRLDVGLPVRGKTGKGAQLYLGIGQAF
jgi:translocation and assembly module TamA